MYIQQRYRAIQESWAYGTIDQDRWHQQLRDLLEEAYLGADSPQGQSGLGAGSRQPHDQ